MESQIQRRECERTETAKRTGRRKPAAQTDVCELEFGLSGAQGDYRKKIIEPEQRHVLAEGLWEEWQSRGCDLRRDDGSRLGELNYQLEIG